MSAFLAPDEVAELTGIRRGKDGKSRYALQALALARMGVPHVVNAAGRPVVPRNFLDRPPERAPTWEPRGA